MEPKAPFIAITDHKMNWTAFLNVLILAFLSIRYPHLQVFSAGREAGSGSQSWYPAKMYR